MKRPKILLVDSDPRLTEAMASLLPRFEILLASGPAAIIKRARESDPELVILEMRIPQACGLEQVMHLRAAEIFSAVIFVVEQGDGLKMEEAAHLGVFDFVEKPLDPAKFRRTVRGALLLGRKCVCNLTSPLSPGLKAGGGSRK